MTAAVDAPALFDTIAEGAAGESPLWGEALRPAAEREPVPVFSPLVPDAAFALGVETIYEGYLLHFGTPRLFAPGDRDTALLLGDYLYAHGLVRIAATGSVDAVGDLAELISLCAQARADGLPGDDVAWAATSALLGKAMLDGAREALRRERDLRPLDAAARAAVGDEAVQRALELHRRNTT
ncbi:MAG: hypothetical protein FJW96_02385 [Actinobacteria bacterium]|nr:hypothetical protein [Actinomycetota bacterium]